MTMAAAVAVCALMTPTVLVLAGCCLAVALG